MVLNSGVWEDSRVFLDCKEIQPIHPKGDQSWIFTGGANAEAEAPILWPPNVKRRLIRKDPDAWKDWRQDKGVTEDEVVGWHHWLNGYEFEQVLGVNEGQGNLACCSPWGRKESNLPEWLNNSYNLRAVPTLQQKCWHLSVVGTPCCS